MLAAKFRPISLWPHGDTEKRRSRWTFKASWSDTLALLDRELRQLRATNIVIGCGLREQDIRMDGWPRTGARVPEHPGVELSFDTPNGRLVYATDVCASWEHNVRAIALGLEALRAVDRHGITRSGEQYAGFRALPSGERGDPDPERGAQIVEAQFGGNVKKALVYTHPDRGGDSRDFADVNAYRNRLQAA